MASQSTEIDASLDARIPSELIDVALVDASTIAAAARLGLSSWHELVRTGRAPQPAFRGPRCTRWRLAEVRAWLAGFRGLQDDGAARVCAKAANASAAAKRKRKRAETSAAA